MKLKVQKEHIIDGLQKAASIIPSKAGAAYLRSIWLKAKDGVLSIMSTDAEIEFTGMYPADVEKEGLAGVQGRAFVDLIRQLPNGYISLSLDEAETNMLIEQGRRKYKLSINSKDWFQELSAWPDGESVSWTGGLLLEYMDRVSFCISEDDTQDSMACLCMKPQENGRIDMCGLNGHQFAIVSFVYDELASRLPETGLLIQRKYLPDIKKWLGEDEIELNMTDKRLYLRRLDGREILSLPRSLLEYPDYNIFMSKLKEDGASRLFLPRREAADSLGRIQVFNSESDKCVFMKLTPAEVDFSAQGGDLGSARESLEAEYNGILDKIAFPTRNLMDILGHFTSDAVTMTFTGEEGPCGITGPDDMGYTVVVMPMKVASANYYEDKASE